MDQLRNLADESVLQFARSPKRSIDSAREILRNPQSKTDLAYFERVAKRRARLPLWAISEIEKANTGDLSRQPLSNTKSGAPSHKQTSIIDLT